MSRLALLIVLLTPCVALSQPSSRIVGYESKMVPATKLAPIEELERGDRKPAEIEWRQVSAVSSAVEEAARNAVQVKFGDGNGFHVGSGVYLGDRYVATAWHVPEGTPGNGVAVFRDGQQIPCRVSNADRQYDLCLLELDQEHPTLTGVEFARENPRVGENLYSAGFAKGFRIFGGAVHHFGTPQGGRVSDWITHSTPGGGSTQGDSGGPIFSESGKLVGCLWGGNGQQAGVPGTQTIGTTTGRMHLIVKPIFPRLAQWRADRIARQIQGFGPCPPGQPCPYPPGGGGGGGVSSSTPVDPNPTPPSLPFDDPPGQQPSPQQPADSGCDCDLEGLVAAIRDIEGKPGPPGEKGERGEQGPPGPPGEVSEEHLAAVVTAIKNDPAMKGPQGDPGPPGKAFSLDDLSDAELDMLANALQSRITHPDIRVVTADGDSKRILEDETYSPGEPIVIDIKSILRAVKANGS